MDRVCSPKYVMPYIGVRVKRKKEAGNMTRTGNWQHTHPISDTCTIALSGCGVYEPLVTSLGQAWLECVETANLRRRYVSASIRQQLGL